MTSSSQNKKNNNSSGEKPFSRKKIEELLSKYPERVPVVISSTSFKMHGLNRFIVPFDMTIAQFMLILREKVELQKEEAIFIFIKEIDSDNNCKSDILAPVSTSIGPLYNQYKDKNLVLNLIYEKEQVFG
jgi:GABA(A) receptor-associated protein